MIRKDLGDIRALTLIRVVLERTEDEELRNQLEEYLQNNEEALRIITLIQQGDSQAENELAELGSVFVKAVAKQYVDKGLSDEELIAASRYGMLRASHKFDKSRGFKFASYAVWWMREAILQEIRKKENNI